MQANDVLKRLRLRPVLAHFWTIGLGSLLLAQKGAESLGSKIAFSRAHFCKFLQLLQKSAREKPIDFDLKKAVEALGSGKSRLKVDKKSTKTVDVSTIDKSRQNRQKNVGMKSTAENVDFCRLKVDRQSTIFDLKSKIDRQSMID